MEVIISIFVLTVGILSAVALISASIKNSIDARNQIIAAGLAQEGAELVRNVRDNNWASDYGAFKEGFTTDNKENCRIDKNYSSDYFECNDNADSKKLYYHESGSDKGFYTHTADGGTETKFKRKIAFKYFNNTGGETLIVNDIVKAEVSTVVIWGNDFPEDLDNCTIGNKCLLVKSVLTEWKYGLNNN